MDYMNEIKSAVNQDKAIIGSRRTVKYLKQNKLRLIVLASNCPEDVRKKIEDESNKANTKVENFNGTQTQLGIFCGKPFKISTISIVK